MVKLIKILYAASEAVPFVKTGGLADVASSLPKELKKLGMDVRVMIPKYKDMDEGFKKEMTFLTSFMVPVGWREQYCRIEYLEYEGVLFYFIDNEYYFKRDDLYGFDDDGERFAYFCRAVLEAIDSIDFKPDIIHCNDWHTGMISPLLREHYGGNDSYSNIKTIFTIHNLKYQGVFPQTILEDLLNLGMEYGSDESLGFYGGVSFMKGGINYSDVITTVSKNYAEEIQYPFFGERLDGLLKHKRDKLYGIVNGIDYDIYNAKKDKYIFSNYDARSIRGKRKQKNKIKLQEQLGLPQKKDIPMLGMVSRLVDMKGLDLVLCVLDDILSLDIQMVVLGTGDPLFESEMKKFVNKYPVKLSVNIFFSEELAHRIYAASDMFLMPSLFEPCGLSQLIAMRYGTLPIVREIGGLKDTVRAYNEKTGEGNGFSFTNYNAHDMLYTIKRALNIYKDRETWKKIAQSAMGEDYSWRKSANIYEKLYERVIETV